METNNRTIFFAAILAMTVVAAGFFYLDSKISVSQHPTQDEWLKVYASHNIHKMTDLWQQRVAVNVDILSQNADGKPLAPKEMIITITSANGQEPIIGYGKNLYTQTAESAAKSILESYGVAGDYKLTVQFID